MSEENPKGNAVKHISIGMAIGFFVGAIVAMLVSPKSGKETRRIVKDKIEDITDTVKTKVRRMKEAKE